MRRLIFATIALLAAFVFWQGARDGASERSALEARGRIASSQPIAEYVSRRSGRKTIYYVQIVVRASDGSDVSVLKEVSSNFISSFQPGMRVQVRYLPEQPTTLDIVGEERGMGMLYIAAVLLGVIGAGLLGSLAVGRTQAQPS